MPRDFCQMFVISKMKTTTNLKIHSLASEFLFFVISISGGGKETHAWPLYNPGGHGYIMPQLAPAQGTPALQICTSVSPFDKAMNRYFSSLGGHCPPVKVPPPPPPPGAPKEKKTQKG